MIITEKWLIENNVHSDCEYDGGPSLVDWFLAQHETDAAKVMLKLIECDRPSDSTWLMERLIKNKKQAVLIAVFAAECVIDIFEAKYPNDKRPREAIDAAKAYSVNPYGGAESSYDAECAAHNAVYFAAHNAARSATLLVDFKSWQATYDVAYDVAYAAATACNDAASDAASIASDAALFAAYSAVYKFFASEAFNAFFAARNAGANAASYAASSAASYIARWYAGNNAPSAASYASKASATAAGDAAAKETQLKIAKYAIEILGL